MRRQRIRQEHGYLGIGNCGQEILEYLKFTGILKHYVHVMLKRPYHVTRTSYDIVYRSPTSIVGI